jgi:hypothetical protein
MQSRVQQAPGYKQQEQRLSLQRYLQELAERFLTRKMRTAKEQHHCQALQKKMAQVQLKQDRLQLNQRE